MSSASRRLRSASTTCRRRRGSPAARSRRGAWGRARSAVRTGLGVAASLRVRPKSGSVTETALSATKGQSGTGATTPGTRFARRAGRQPAGSALPPHGGSGPALTRQGSTAGPGDVARSRR
jgi:hypothetical protein